MPRWTNNLTFTSSPAVPTLAQQLHIEAHVPAALGWRGFSSHVDSDRIAFNLTPNTAVSFFSTTDVDAAASGEDYNSFDAFARLQISIELTEFLISRVEDSAYFSLREFDPALEATAKLFATYEHRGAGYIRGFADLTLAGGATVSVVPRPRRAP